jgi:tetratricopeptide (TPR) repeat protein
MPYSLKRLPRACLDAAICKAEHYRTYQQPEEAESICRDVLDIDRGHAPAWKVLGLSLTDRFAAGPVGLLERALEAFERLPDVYERTYHKGVAWERAAKAHAERNEAQSAVAAFEEALALFESAERMRPDLPDAVLRWNRCVRFMNEHPALRAAAKAPPEEQVRFGD